MTNGICGTDAVAPSGLDNFVHPLRRATPYAIAFALSGHNSRQAMFALSGSNSRQDMLALSRPNSRQDMLALSRPNSRREMLISPERANAIA